MPLDPAVEMLLSLVNVPGAPQLDTMTPAEGRESWTALINLLAYEGAAVESVVARDIAGVPCQIVTPQGTGPFPILIWIHGGGWVIGSATESLATCRDLAAAVGCVVVDVDYGLAPEHPFPVPVDQCTAVTRWVLEHGGDLGGDPTRVAIGGDSAGGNLSAVVALEVPGLAFQLLVYPVTDVGGTHPSMDENGEGYLLTKRSMIWFTNHYLEGTGADPEDPRVSPLHADGSALAAAPPALVITAEFDPLRDEGEAYAERLREAGVAVTATRYGGQIHAFFSMPSVLPAGVTANAEAAAALRTALAT